MKHIYPKTITLIVLIAILFGMTRMNGITVMAGRAEIADGVGIVEGADMADSAGMTEMVGMADMTDKADRAAMTSSAKAITDEQSAAIQSFLDEICVKSNIPGIAASVRVGDDVLYFSSGYADRETPTLVNEHTLFELASVSKAFTAFGILLLEEQGLLSMDDSVQKYLPWLTFRYNGKLVDMSGVTLNHFLHHTSGLVNSKHYGMIPMGSGEDMLKKTVETFKGAELAFAPGERFKYGTMNYDILGYVIAVVSGQSYEAFLQTQVLDPLGLHETYMYSSEAKSTGQMAKGYAAAFMRTIAVESPVYEGNKPAGYIISCAKDMQRWADIQMGLIEQIPKSLKAVAIKSHRADMSVPTSLISTSLSGYYAGGWRVTADGAYIGHGGNNPNFTTDVTIYPKEKISVTILSNSSMTNNAIAPTLADNIKGILDGELNQRYLPGIFRIIDTIITCVTIIGVLLAALFLWLGLRRWKSRSQNPMPRKRIVLTVVWIVITAITVLLGVFFPMLIGGDWNSALEDSLYSLLAAIIALVMASGSATWFVFTRRR